MFSHKDTEWKTERTGLSQKQQEFALDDNKESEKQAGEEFCEDVKEGKSNTDVTNSQIEDSADRRALLLLHRDLRKAHSRNSRKRPLKMPRFGGRLQGMVAHEDCSTCSHSSDSLKWSIHSNSSKKVMIRFLVDFTANPDQA